MNKLSYEEFSKLVAESRNQTVAYIEETYGDMLKDMFDTDSTVREAVLMLNDEDSQMEGQ